MDLKQANSILSRNGVKVYPTFTRNGIWFIEYEINKKVTRINKEVTRKKNTKESVNLINDALLKTIFFLAGRIKK